MQKSMKRRSLMGIDIDMASAKALPTVSLRMQNVRWSDGHSYPSIACFPFFLFSEPLG